jgi:adenosylcobinamide-GDP ribazoletransferase
VIAALGFLTILGSARIPTPRATRWFGVVGLFVGSVLGGLWVLATDAFPPLVAAGLVVTADLVLTGFLHLDGLADAGDGLIAPLDRQRRLDVMRSPEVGAFGLGLVLLVLGLRWAVLASVTPTWWLLALVWALSRVLAGAVPSLVDYARSEGLATPFLGDPLAVWMPLVSVPMAVGVYVLEGVAGAAALVACVLAAWGVVQFARRRIGGFTGDVLGAVVLMSETAALVVYSANW